MPRHDLPSFDLDEIEADVEPIAQFKLGGRMWTVRNRDLIPVDVLEDVMGPAGVQVKKFFRAVLVEDEVDEFIEMLAEPGEAKLNLPRLSYLMENLVSVIMDRPTERSGRSTSGRTATQRGSGAGSSSAATPRSRRAS
jgi:hypothetical protein